MEAIDDYANNNIARSLAYTSLEYRQRHSYLELLPIATQLLQQRIQFLGPSKGSNKKEWDEAVQWQKDSCTEIIDAICSGQSQSSYLEDLYRNPVYYKRLDPETLHAIVEFAQQDEKHYAVILALEDGNEDCSELKYHNTKELSEQEWREVKSWAQTTEEAERLFLMMVTQKHTQKNDTVDTPQNGQSNRDAPEDYWGDWSSEDGMDTREDRTTEHTHSEYDSEDNSDDEFYTRWSKNPGTLTPALNENGVVDEQQEIDEEYDQSYNPLFTVPSVHSLMDSHSNALNEITQILQTTLPSETSTNGKRITIQPMTQINPLPKVVSHGIEKKESWRQYGVPGTYPETPHSGLVELFPKPEEPSSKHTQKTDTNKALLLKGLQALVSKGHLLGFSGSDMMAMLKEVVNEE
ncbi:hypothetical protein BDF14DRAFT_1803893 [Spinellus fusiger]|nr:hypothetical protein BDF14DRAFT_1803893 [Spinellus fusiger]